VVQNTVGAEVYGNYFTLFNIAIIFQIFLDLGIENFIRKDIARHAGRSGYYFSNIIALKLLLLIPYLLVCFLIASYKGITSKDYLLLFLILFNQFLASIILYIRANLGGLQLFKTESFISVMDRSLMIIIAGTLLLHPVTNYLFHIKWFVLAQTISYTFTLITGLIILLKKTGTITFHFQPSRMAPVLKRLWPYASLVLLMAFYYRADSIILSIILPDGNEQAGIFAHSFRILDFMSNYALLFPILLLPIFSKIIHQKQKVDSLLQFSSLLLIVPSLAAICPAIIYRNELFEILYEEETVLSARVFAILTISYFGMCVSYTFGALLTANGNLKQLNIMAAFAVLISLCLNIILIPRFQVVGAAIANASTQVFTILAHIFLAKRIFRLRFNPGLFIKLTIYILVLTAGGFFIKQLNIQWLTGFLVSFILFLLFAMALGLVNIGTIRTILRERV
jgi:O-antigen/teichoic acid export membrane protein